MNKTQRTGNSDNFYSYLHFVNFRATIESKQLLSTKHRTNIYLVSWSRNLDGFREFIASEHLAALWDLHSELLLSEL